MDTSYLYDNGEDGWTRKYHFGCGGVYLQGYINCDVSGELASLRPDLVEQNRTTIADYYARLDGTAYNLPTRRATVCDKIVDVSKMHEWDCYMDKIISIQLFEHLSPVRAFDALDNWHKWLKAGRPLIISVPDMLGTLDLIEHGGMRDIDFALRHLRGRQGDEYNTHHAWYTKDTLTELVSWFGFSVEGLPNPHFYPAICIKAIKE